MRLLPNFGHRRTSHLLYQISCPWVNISVNSQFFREAFSGHSGVLLRDPKRGWSIFHVFTFTFCYWVQIKTNKNYNCTVFILG